MEHEQEPLPTGAKVCVVFSVVAMLAAWIGFTVYFFKLPHIGIMDLMSKLPPSPPVPPEIELTSMDFTLHNITQTRLSAKWDLSIRIPYYLPDSYICLNGDLQVALLYKNVAIATSSPQKYNNLRYRSAQLLKVSAVVSEKDISGSIGKGIMEDVKEKKEVLFGSRVFLTDCRQNRPEAMGFGCHEATLRFEPRSEMKATMFGKHPTCINF